MTLDRYIAKDAGPDWAVVDFWTGETVAIALIPQDGLREQDARETAAMLSARYNAGIRDELR